MTLWEFVVRSVLRRPMRCLPAMIALAAAIAAITVTYSIAAWTERKSRVSLSFAVRDAKAWILPASGIEIDADTGLFLTKGLVPEGVVHAARSINGAQWKVVLAGKVIFPSGVRYVMSIGDLSGCLFAASDASDARAAAELLRRLDPREAGPCQIRVDSSIPKRAVVGSDLQVRKLLGGTAGASWLLLASGSSRSVLQDEELGSTVRVTSVPSSNSDGKPQFIPIDTSVSRFDPFSFKTKFASLMIHRTVSSLLGSFARVVFLLSLMFAASNALAGLKNRRAEIGLLSAYGFDSEIVRVFLMDSLLVQGGGYVLGSVLGGFVVRLVLPVGEGWVASYEGAALSLTYLPILIVLVALISTQSIASRRPISLVRTGD